MSTHARLPGRRMWVLLVFVLAMLVLLRVMVQDDLLRRWVGEGLFENAHWLLGLFVALVVALFVVGVHARSDAGGYEARDRAFLFLVFAWVLSLGSVAAMDLFDAAPWTVLLRHLAYQLAVALTLYFLHTTVSGKGSLTGLVWLPQLVLAVGFIVWGFLDPAASTWAVIAWRATNVLGFTAALLVLGRALLADSQVPPWLLLGACLMGFGLGLTDMANVDGSAIPVTTMHYVFAAYLLMVWLFLGGFLGRLPLQQAAPMVHSDNSVLGGAFAHTDLDDGDAGIDPQRSAQEQMRRRIAQELHDGVGSQLVSILASLDRRVPQQRAVADAVEQCLLDVKIMVDDIDHAKECVLDALARLRYRVQHSLDRLGIRLIWELRDEEPLEQLCDERSRQVLRIAQEALANVMRHSRARTVSVCCLYLPEMDALLLDISDDGVGFDTSKEAMLRGKGLVGMARRARSIHAELDVWSAPGKGSTVRLLVPVVASATGVFPLQDSMDDMERTADRTPSVEPLS